MSTVMCNAHSCTLFYSSMQVLVHVMDLMAKNQFETISSFFHAAMPEEELQLRDNPLKKIWTVHEKIRAKCVELYQPLRELSR